MSNEPRCCPIVHGSLTTRATPEIPGDLRWRAALIDGCLDAIVSVRPDGTVVTWNGAAELLYGYPSADMVGYSLARVIAAEPHAPGGAASLEHVARGEAMPSTDVLCTRRDGRVIEVALTISPVRDDAGTLLGATVIGRDVSASRVAERRLREGEIHLRSVVDTAADGIIAITSAGIIESVNPAAERLFGYRADELIGNNVRMLMPAPYCHEHDHYLANFAHTGVAKVIGIGREVVGRRKDGTIFPMELAVSAMRIGEEQKFTGIVRDITERKQAEEALRGREAQIRSIVETAVDGIIVIDARGHVEAYNPAAERLFGYTSEEVIGQNVRLLMPEPYRSQHDEFIRAFLETGERRVIGIGREVVGMRKDGSTFPMELAVSEMRVGDQRKFTGLVRDITARKHAEEEVTSYLSQVEESSDRMQRQAQQLTEQAEALADARDMAEAAMRAKSDFLAVMSHEIRTPMNGVIGMAELLRGTPLDEDQRHCIDTILRSGEALLAIINDVLDFSKLEAGRVEFETVGFDIRGLVEDVADLFAGVAGRRGIELICDIDLAVPSAIMGDPTRVRQILTNLVSNALKFTERGEVVVRLGLGPDTSVAQLSCAVSDTGVGISPEGLSRLFQSFSQGEASTSRKYGGTGLGLAISKRLVESMGGSIGVESTQGTGSTFSFTLPFVVAGQASPLPLKGLDGRRLLVVDDSDACRQTIGRLLAGAGAQVGAVPDAIAGLALLEGAAAAGEPFELAVIDYEAGDEAIAALCRAIGHAEGSAYTPFVVASVNALELRDELKGFGACAVVSKPVRAMRLFDAVRRGLLPRSGSVPEPVPSASAAAAAVTSSGCPCHATTGTTSPVAPARERIAGDRCRVLAADDNEVNRLVLRRMLERLGHDIEMVEDGQQALAAYADRAWDVVLMDCNMPGMDGFAAATAIRALEVQRGAASVPIIAVTASILPADQDRCAAVGMDACLMKPIVLAQLDAAIREAVAASSRPSASLS